MKDALEQFIDALNDAGMPPKNAAGIKADNKWNGYTVQGDKKPVARYRLEITADGFGYGNYINHKDGECHTFNSKTEKKLSPEEMKKRKEIIAEVKLKREKEQREEWAKVAAECLKIWGDAKQDNNHPYLVKKGIDGKGTRVATYYNHDGKKQENILLIPMWKNGKLASLQRIWTNGFKAFWENGDASGAYTAFVDEENDKRTIIIVEGFATGASVRKAMPETPVIVAYNTGNLLPVARVMRKKHPESRIILAADNDQWTFAVKKYPLDEKGEKIVREKIAGDDPLWLQWRKEGRMWNPGLEKAKQVGVKIGAHVIFPDISPDDPKKNTDFNDMEHLHGIESVRKRILVAVPAITQRDSADDYDDSQFVGTPLSYEDFENQYSEIDSHSMSSLYGNEIIDEPQVADDGELNLTVVDDDPEDQFGEWRSKLFCKDDGDPKPNSLRNAQLFILNHKRYKGMFCFDEFSQEKVVTRCPPWENEKKFTPRTLRDEDKTELTADLEPRGIVVSISNLSKILDAAIMQNCKNPAREYFKKLEWDGVPRLNTWLRTYCGCIKDDHEYLAAVGRKWLTAAVSRIMRPGCKFDHILIFEGEQNIGKSMMLRELATIHGRAYFDDSIRAKDLPNPSIVPKLQGCLIIELAEMSGFKKMSIEEAKQIISTQEDRIVKKYQNEPTRLPRQFVFAGTMNPYQGYLDDPTGNRRYWPVKCEKIDLEAVKRDKEQLWAEATHYYRQKEPLWLSDDALSEKAETVVKNRLNLHPWHPDLEKLTQEQKIIEMSDIWSALKIDDRSRWTKEAQDNISRIMTHLGCEFKRKQFGSKRRKVWVVGEKLDMVDKLPATEADIEENLDW